MNHFYKLGQICVFTNKGTSGIAKHNGKKCEITRLKPKEEWSRRDEPEYVIEFFDGGGFGVRECELKPDV
ncbi:MAG TPA: hypothetical protein P5323_00985 [Candidatus Moranbacteria bacterium]|nr:hypothetical protein [Candidatus Moranbacteria bacterium]HRY27688.1 hypothetical protein [Candidatus Moranbacteria bacterium]HSA07989.1 hypothetical protein [Candidatus Moranbacteria bacterium]